MLFRGLIYLAAKKDDSDRVEKLLTSILVSLDEKAGVNHRLLAPAAALLIHRQSNHSRYAALRPLLELLT